MPPSTTAHYAAEVPQAEWGAHAEDRHHVPWP